MLYYIEIIFFYDDNSGLFDRLIYHNDMSTSIIRVKSIEEGLVRFKKIKGEKAIDDITDVYVFNRGNNDPEHRMKIEDWKSYC